MFLIHIYLEDIREITDAFVKDYNEEKPHESLVGLSPVKYREMKKQKIVVFELNENRIFVQYDLLPKNLFI